MKKKYNLTKKRKQLALNRLAAYEDSGLSPQEVRELAKAKAEGRLVVLEGGENIENSRNV